MPNLTQAKKALRSANRRRTFNDKWRVKLRAASKDLRLAFTGNDKAAAEKAYIEVSSALDRASRRNIIPPNRASRKKSRLAKQIAKMTAK